MGDVRNGIADKKHFRMKSYFTYMVLSRFVEDTLWFPTLWSLGRGRLPTFFPEKYMLYCPHCCSSTIVSEKLKIYLCRNQNRQPRNPAISSEYIHFGRETKSQETIPWKILRRFSFILQCRDEMRLSRDFIMSGCIDRVESLRVHHRDRATHSNSKRKWEPGLNRSVSMLNNLFSWYLRRANSRSDEEVEIVQHTNEDKRNVNLFLWQVSSWIPFPTRPPIFVGTACLSGLAKGCMCLVFLFSLWMGTWLVSFHQLTSVLA